MVYTGFDYSDEIINHIKSTQPNLSISQADATTYQPEFQAHDIIILIGGLHHVPDHAPGVVAKMAEGLKPGGYFLNFEPTSGNRIFTVLRDMVYSRNDIFDEETERAFGVGELMSMFEAAGLRKHSVFFPGLLAYVLYYNPYAFPGLNIGGPASVKACFGLDRLFYRSFIGRIFSFATLSIWQKPHD